MITPRSYQINAVNAAAEMMRIGKRRVLLVSPTGSGKTPTAVFIIMRALAKNKTILFLAHRRELIEQCCDKLTASGIHDYGVIMAGSKQVRPGAPVQVASIQTLARRELPPADLIFIDEAHRAQSASYITILSQYPRAVVIGLTATPERLDGKGLDDIFDDMIVVETVPNLIDQGYLVRPDCYVGPSADLAGVKTRRGDYDETQLAAACDQPKLVGDIVANWHRLAKGRPTAVFAASIEHAHHLAAEFHQSGVAVSVVSGKTHVAEREAIISDWRARRITVCVNVYVFVEGFDFPELEVCVLARPTQSVSLYLQAVGRVMRPASGKIGAMILDHANCIRLHGAPHIHREWTLEGLTKKRAADPLHVCDDCGLAFAAESTWWFDEMQPDHLRDRAAALWRAPAAERGIAVCPGCQHATCRLCHSPFQADPARRDRDGIAWDQTLTCPHCLAVYADAPHLLDGNAQERGIPETTDDHLVALTEAQPTRVIVLNEYKRLLNEARQAGRKRGWVYWRLRDRFDEDTLRDSLPRHTGNWWKQSA